jgi:hypothetical protein
MSIVVNTLAHWLAKEAAKAQSRAQGIKPSQMTASGIARAATVYFDQHRAELIERATGMVRSSPRLQKLAEREERDHLRRANVRSDAQRLKR